MIKAVPRVIMLKRETDLCLQCMPNLKLSILKCLQLTTKNSNIQDIVAILNI